MPRDLDEEKRAEQLAKLQDIAPPGLFAADGGVGQAVESVSKTAIEKGNGQKNGVPFQISNSVETGKLVEGTDTFDVLHGEGGNDEIYGYGAGDKLYGEGGNDYLDGGYGNDQLYGGAGDDTLYGNLGTDQLYGEDGNDTLLGDAGRDTLDGGAGDDILFGGRFNDNMTGGAGSDTFGFTADDAFHSVDTIKDFSTAEGDKIDISDVLSGYDPLSDAISEFVQFTDDGGNTIMAIDADGGADNFVAVASILNVTGLDATNLEANSNLITA